MMAKDVDEFYERLDLIGEGTYGLVYKARDRRTNAMVALKRIPLDSSRDGFPVTAMREIKLLAGISFSNVVALLDVCISNREPNAVYMVLEYVEFDLVGLMSYLKANASFHGNSKLMDVKGDVCSSPMAELDQHQQQQSANSATISPLAANIANVKCILRQILLAVDHLHRECQIVHRDIKGSNILVSRSGLVKLVDFGLAKRSAHLGVEEGVDFVANRNQQLTTQCMTNRVITLWFRPPEILLGSNDYGFPVDIWGVGCILIEMLLGKPAFAGMDELSQLEAICKKLGPLPMDRMLDCDVPWGKMAMDALSDPTVCFAQGGSEQCVKSTWLDTVVGPLLGPLGLDLLRRMLALAPKDRITASDALKHQWFEQDLSVNPDNLISSILASCNLEISQFSTDWHELDHRRTVK